MRQLFLDKSLIAIKEVCQPNLDEHSVLIAVRYSCVSPGTENATIAHAQSLSTLFTQMPSKVMKIIQSITQHGVEGTRALIRERLSGLTQQLGYSCAGQVVAIGTKVTKFRAGDFVACAGAGYANHAEFVAVPQNLVVHVPNEQLLPAASMTTLGAIALQGWRRADLQIGESVCVLGLGLLGQLTVQLAKSAGCEVIGIDIIEDRIQLAKKFGADKIINASKENSMAEMMAATAHQGVDCTIITAASTSNALMQQAMEITRKKGKVVLVGDVGLGLERNPLYKKEIDLLISCSYGPGRYDHSYEQENIDYPYAYVRWTENRNMQAFISLLEKKLLNIDDLLAEYVPLEKAPEAYAQLQSKKKLALIIDYGKPSQIENCQLDEIKEPKFVPAVASKVRVGFVGAGGFAKVKLMPIVARLPNVKINAIVDTNIANSISISKVYAASRALSDDRALFHDNLVDAVVIASPHKFHCDQALTALQNGKAVFLEKPMVTDFDQLDRLYAFLQRNPSIPFCVDYNRSFSPFIQKIKDAVSARKSPLMIHYRMNAGFIPKDHWVQTRIGAGRIIGEACHIFDLFYFLTDARPIAVSVEAIRPKNDDLFPTDNFSAQVNFSDGSVCTLLYTALGNPGLGKERMEVYFDSKTIVMDDYKTIQGFGLPLSFNEACSSPDKGHEYLLHLFFETIQQPAYKPIFTLNRLYDVAKLTLIIDQLACAGGGSKELVQ